MADLCPICKRRTLEENCHLLVVWCENTRCRFEAPWADSPEQWKQIVARWRAQHPTTHQEAR